MKIIESYDLTQFNTFKISAKARYFFELNNENELKDLLAREEFKNNEKLFLGKGSNVLFVKDFEGIVLLNSLKGMEIKNEGPEEVFIRSMGGELWNDLVTFSVDHNYWGIENMALIPGTVGAAPVQNIGAYGMELKDVLEEVEAYDIESGEKRIFKKEDCGFGYRTSVFKTNLKRKYFISAITIKLSKKEKKNINYKVLQEYLEKNNLKINCSKDISNVVSSIRKSKLPDPRVIGNAGSFFKNILLEKNKLDELLEKNPEMPFFEEEGQIKVPAAWLIEQCGWKGKRLGNIGVHDKQALILVNFGGGKGKEIMDLSEEIIASVFSKFGLVLEREVNLI